MDRISVITDTITRLNIRMRELERLRHQVKKRKNRTEDPGQRYLRKEREFRTIQAASAGGLFIRRQSRRAASRRHPASRRLWPSWPLPVEIRAAFHQKLRRRKLYNCPKFLLEVSNFRSMVVSGNAWSKSRRNGDCVSNKPGSPTPEAIGESNWKRRDKQAMRNVKNKHLEMMSLDELWRLHEEIRSILSTKLDAEKRELERRLVQLMAALNKDQRRVDPIGKFALNTAIPRPGLDERGNRVGWVLN
jgi:hypothetical protein